MSRPSVRKEPVVAPGGAADANSAHFFGTVLYDGGRYRMWYYGKPDRQHAVPCYAESDDGISWTKPELGQVEFGGNRSNNALQLTDETILGVAVIRDDEDPDPQRHYKMVYNPRQERGKVADRYGRPRSTLRTATSADGISWMPSGDYALDVFAEHSSFFKFNGLFMAHAQGLLPSENGHAGARQGYAWVSTDFDSWLEAPAQAFMLPEPADPALRGHGLAEDSTAVPGLGEYHQVHLGVGGAPFGNVVVGVYGLWYQHSWGEGGTTCDLGLAVSNDGIHFREPVKGHAYIPAEESPVTPVPGKDYPTLLCQGNGLLNVGDETLIYHGRWRNGGSTPDYYGEVAVATLPRDRWGALGLFPDETQGYVWSAPVILPEGGVDVRLNIESAPNAAVELSDERFGLLPDYSGPNSGVCQDGSGLGCPVIWPKADPAALGQRPVRLRVHLEKTGPSDPRLYAVYLHSR